jgi:prepilin-type N-terminal cleavage/methylation domain-containing protein
VKRTSRHSPAFTLAEVVAVVAIMGLVAMLAITRLRLQLDRIAARTAVADAALVVARAREEAIAQHAVVSLRVDTGAGTLALQARGERLAVHALGHEHGVTLSTTRDSIAFDVRGLGYGAANMTLIAKRGAAANTLVVSRLGRIRY